MCFRKITKNAILLVFDRFLTRIKTLNNDINDS